MKNFFFLGSLALIFLPLNAAQISEIDSTELLKCTFSSRHHNRIAVDGQRIKKVIYPEGDIAIRIEEESGQIFVQAMVDNPEITTVSIVTSEGIVQDLELSFTDKASEILILKQQTENEENNNGLIAFGCDDEVDSIQNVIESMLSGMPPEEYIPVEDRQICCKVKRDLILRSSVRLVGPIYTIYVLILENSGHRCERVHESEINCVDGEWVYLEKTELGSSEKMLALIGVRTYEQQ